MNDGFPDEQPPQTPTKLDERAVIWVILTRGGKIATVIDGEWMRLGRENASFVQLTKQADGGMIVSID
jgi:hypothetical protein